VPVLTGDAGPDDLGLRGREERCEVDVALGPVAARRGRRTWLAASQQHAAVAMLTQPGAVDERGGPCAHQDFARVGLRFALDRRRCTGAGDEEITVAAGEEEQRELAAVDAL